MALKKCVKIRTGTKRVRNERKICIFTEVHCFPSRNRGCVPAGLLCFHISNSFATKKDNTCVCQDMVVFKLGSVMGCLKNGTNIKLKKHTNSRKILDKLFDLKEGFYVTDFDLGCYVIVFCSNTELLAKNKDFSLNLC